MYPRYFKENTKHLHITYNILVLHIPDYYFLLGSIGDKAKLEFFNCHIFFANFVLSVNNKIKILIKIIFCSKSNQFLSSPSACRSSGASKNHY